MSKLRKTTAIFVLTIIVLTVCACCSHQHKFDKEWSCDYQNHWHKALCGDTAETADKGGHIYENDLCTICGYKRAATLSLFTVNGNFHTQLQVMFIADSYDNAYLYADGRAERSLPQDIGIYWNYQPESLPLENLKEFKLTFSCDKGNIKSVAVTPNLNDNGTYSYQLQNPYLNAAYDVQVQAIDNGNQIITEDTIRFTTTANGPRNVKIDGVTNARDLGGYVTDQGEIKQGLLYRTARLNKSNQTQVTVEITDEGIRTMLNDLKVKTEIDLRGHGDDEPGAITQSVLGDGVNYFLIKMVYGSDMFKRKEHVKQAFDILCDERNYPVFFHCHIGTDRTGFIAFLCLALLGADEQTIYTDYMFSNFGHIGSKRDPHKITNYLNAVAEYDGNTLANKTESYLYECGITPQQIQAFRDIMLLK